MELKKIETLLLQEMEEVKGGKDGTCVCPSGAGQAGELGGTCKCTNGGAGQLLTPPNPDFPVCMCNASGGAAQ